MPSGTFCKDNDVYTCDAYGVSSTLTENCNDAYYHCAPYYANLVYC